MPYRYVAYTAQGEVVRGTVEAESEEEAEEALWRSDYTIVSLDHVRSGPGLHELVPSLFGVGTDELIIFSRQLAILLESGIPLLRGLRLLHTQSEGRGMESTLEDIIEDIQQGEPLSAAMEQHPLVFPNLYIHLIEVGEQTGRLETVLRQMADYLEREQALRRKVTGAMAYPAFILFMTVVVIWVMLTVTLPALMGLFNAFRAELPIYTRILVSVTDFVGVYQLHILATVGGLLAAVYLYTRTETGHRHWDRLLLALPLVGPALSAIAVSRFSMTLSMLLRAGLPIPRIMELVVASSTNKIFEEAIDRVRVELMQGRGLSQPMAQEDVFPTMLVQMVSVGEEAGTLDENLATMARFFEEEADRRLDTLTSMIQPALMLIIGGIVGFIAVSVIGPMYSVYGQLQ